MVKISGPFVYAWEYINSLSKGTTDLEKTDIVFSNLIAEITSAGSCIEDVIAVQKFVAPGYDNPSTREAYSKYFKPYMPSLTAVTYDDLIVEGGTKDDVCKILIVAVKGCSKGLEYDGIKLDRVVYPSGSPLEAVMGYSRAVKAGPFVFVGGTTSVLPDKTVFGAGDSKEQDTFIWEKIVSFAKKAGASDKDIVRVKKWVMKDYKSSGVCMPAENCQHPKTDTVQIARLTREGQLEEVELFAVIGIADGKVKEEFASYFDLF